MFDFFKKLKKNKRNDISQFHGKVIRYVTERKDNEDIIIGRNGALTVKDNTLIVFSSSEVVFRGASDKISVSDLLSGDGIIVKGEDMEHGNQVRCIVVFYTKY